MKEMVDSGIEWIGDIPNDWKLNKIKYLTTSRTVKYRLSDVDGQYIGLENVESASGHYVKTESDYEEGFYDGCEIGDLLYGKLRPNLAKVIIAPFKACCTGEFEVISESRIGKRFLQYCMLTEGFTHIVTASTYGAKMPRASWDFIKNIGIAYPDEVQRERIVSFLDDKCSEIDALSADIQSEIDTLEAYKRSIITEAVTKGLDKNVPMKESGIEWAEKVPIHWEVMHNKYIMKKIKDTIPVYRGEDILSLTMNGVIVRDLDAGGKMPATFDGYQKLYIGNLLMCLFDYDVTPRCIGLIKNEGLTSPAYSQFTMKNNNSAEYYYYYYLMIDFTKELLHLAKNLRHSFTEDQLGMIKAPVPPVEEQISIAHFLDEKCTAIDAVIAQKNEQLEVVKDYKKSVIYEYITGKKEVPSV